MTQNEQNVKAGDDSLLILLKQSVMKENKILELIKEKSEKISDFIEQWNTTTLGGMRLTNVGRAIAHVHLEDCAGIEEDFRL